MLNFGLNYLNAQSLTDAQKLLFPSMYMQPKTASYSATMVDL